MLKKERQSLILREVNIHNKVLLTDISSKFNVSGDTVRRDLQELSDADKIIKVRGGALSKSYLLYSYKEHDIYAYEEKTIIAQKAISLIRDGMLILISGGSTNLEIARLLPKEMKATFVTVSLTTAMQLQDHPNCETIFIGGRLSKTAGISIGGDVMNQLSGIRADLCFIGTNAIDAQLGVTDSDWEVVIVKKAMIEAAGKVALLSISEKLNTSQRLTIAPLDKLDLLITELDGDHELLLPYKKAGLEIM